MGLYAELELYCKQGFDNLTPEDIEYLQLREESERNLGGCIKPDCGRDCVGAIKCEHMKIPPEYSISMGEILAIAKKENEIIERVTGVPRDDFRKYVLSKQ